MSLSKRNRPREAERYKGCSSRFEENRSIHNTSSKDTSRITSYTNLKTFQDTRTGEVLVEVCGHKYPIDSTSSFDDDATPCTTEDMDYVEDDQTHSEHLEKDTIDSMAATANDISMHSETNLLLEKLICYGEESESTRALETRIESTTENRFSVAMITDEDGTRTTAPFIPQCAMRKSTISSTSSECRTVPQCSMRKSTISSTSSECRTVPQCSMRKSTISSTSSDCRIVQQPHDLPACRQYVSLPFSMSPISDPVTLPAVRADSSQNFQMTSSLGGSDSRSTALVERNNSSKFCPKTLPLSFSTSILNPGTQRTLQQDVPLYFSRSTFQNPVTQANSSQPLPKDVPLCYSSASVSNLMTLPVVSDFNQNNVPMPSTLSFSHHEPYQSFQPEHLQVVKPVIRSQITSHSQPAKKTCRLWEYIRNLLMDPTTNPCQICWEDREKGMFKLVQPRRIAYLWGMKKGNPNMTYEKFSRAMRYYYRKRVFAPVPGKKHCYSFGPNAHGWK